MTNTLPTGHVQNQDPERLGRTNAVTQQVVQPSSVEQLKSWYAALHPVPDCQGLGLLYGDAAQLKDGTVIGYRCLIALSLIQLTAPSRLVLASLIRSCG